MDVGDFNRLIDADLAGVGDFLTHDDLHQGGLSSAVDADKCYFF